MNIDFFFKKNKINVFAIGETDTINAPEGFHPKDILPESKSIIVFGCVIDEYIFKLDSKVKSFYLRGLINRMDIISFELCEILSAEGFPSIPIPTFAPIRVKNGKVRGIISLKHFAEAVGLGLIGENTLLISKDFGNRLCLSAVLTEKKFKYKMNNNSELCLKCNKCINICPTHAISNKKVELTKCLNFTYSIPKFLKPVFIFLLKIKMAEKYFETIITALGWNSDMACSLCLTICPYFHISNSNKS